MSADDIARGETLSRSGKYTPTAQYNGQVDIPPPPEPPPDNDGAAVTDVPEFAVTTLSNVTPEQVKWLWPGRLPLGKVITLDGDPGKGKSTLALTFGAIVTTGGEWPDGSQCDYPGDVILMSAEDGLADTVRPRLDAAGGDPARVHAVQGVPLPLDDDGEALRMATLADIDLLRRLIKRTSARLVIVDVLMAYLPTGTDSYRDQDVRQVLARMAALAESTGCAILLLRHLNKGKGDPLYRGGGSIGIVGASRVGLLAAPDLDDDDVRVLAALKNNLAPIPASLTYRLVSDDRYDVARIEWIGVSEHDARALLTDHDTQCDTDTGTEARHWLQDYLIESGRVLSRQAKDDGRKAGYSQASIDRAASKLRVISEPEGFPRITHWKLPPSATSPHAQSSQPPQPSRTPETETTDTTDVTGGDFQPPTGPGRCDVCGWHVETQGHHPDCTANSDEEPL